jgi:hypothetical protein
MFHLLKMLLSSEPLSLLIILSLDFNASFLFRLYIFKITLVFIRAQREITQDLRI